MDKQLPPGEATLLEWKHNLFPQAIMSGMFMIRNNLAQQANTASLVFPTQDLIVFFHDERSISGALCP